MERDQNLNLLGKANYLKSCKNRFFTKRWLSRIRNSWFKSASDVHCQTLKKDMAKNALLSSHLSKLLKVTFVHVNMTKIIENSNLCHLYNTKMGPCLHFCPLA